MPDSSGKVSALAVIRSVEEGDLDKFDQAFKNIDDECAALLEKFLVEVVTGKYEVFQKEDSPKFAANPGFARAILKSWSRVDNARGKMGARMAFETVIHSARRK